LERPPAHGEGKVRLVLMHPDGSGVERHSGIAPEPNPRGLQTLYRRCKLRRTVKRAERKLRR
jgi:hypothetical protein